MGNHLRFEKKVAVVRLLVEGNSHSSISRIIGVHIDTVMRLMVRVGEYCQGLLDRLLRGLSPTYIQVDEMWTFVYKKEHRCNVIDKALGFRGSQYTYVAMDPETKLVLSFLTGKRCLETTQQFITDLKSRLAVDRVQVSSDGYEPYIDAIEEAFGAKVDYAQVLKHYTGGTGYQKFVRSEKRIIEGDPKRRRIGTSYIERQNLTMRMHIKRMCRKTLAFSKKLRNLRAAVALHFAFYNFCRVHRTLRVTPAMEAGLTDHVWDLHKLLAGESNYEEVPEVA